MPIVQVLLLCYFASPVGIAEWGTLGSFVLVTIVASYMLYKDQRPYSLNKIWWLFSCIFMGFVPSIQAAVHHTPWGENDISAEVMLQANMLVLCCFILYSITRHLIRTHINTRKETTEVNRHLPQAFAHVFKWITPIVLVICAVILYTTYGIKGLLLRGYFDARAQELNATYQLLMDKSVRGVLLYIVLMAIVLYKRKQLGLVYLIIVLLTVILLNFPLAIPRYLAFTIYFSLLLAWGNRWLLTGRRLIWIVLAGLLLAGPLLSITRYAGADMSVRIHNPIALFKHAYLTSDYDTYSSLCRTMSYVDTASTTHGKQLVGVALFFVPRTIWVEKPIGSGAYLFTQLGIDFKNVSCNYLAEGYINFGIIGSVLFTVILAILIAMYDNNYWVEKNNFTSLPSYLQIFYWVALGMLLFILRGDLLSSYAFTVGIFASGWLLHQTIRIIARKKQ